MLYFPRRSPPFFFFNDTATTEIYALSLHDALPISEPPGDGLGQRGHAGGVSPGVGITPPARSEEHTSELQSPVHLVCRLLLEKKKRHDSSATSLNPGANSVGDAPIRSSRAPRQGAL